MLIEFVIFSFDDQIFDNIYLCISEVTATCCIHFGYFWEIFLNINGSMFFLHITVNIINTSPFADIDKQNNVATMSVIV